MVYTHSTRKLERTVGIILTGYIPMTLRVSVESCSSYIVRKQKPCEDEYSS